MKIFTNIQLKFSEILFYKTLKSAIKRVFKNMRKSVLQNQATQIYLKLCLISKGLPSYSSSFSDCNI